MTLIKKYLALKTIFTLIFMTCVLASTVLAANDALTKPMRDRTAESRLGKPLPVETGNDAFIKLGRGLANILEGPCELYVQTTLIPPNSDAIYAFFTGVTRGLSMFVVRELVGIYDVITFPIPLPKGYVPLIEPATPLTDLEWRREQALG